MMRRKNILSLLLLVVIVSACSDDDTPKRQFSFEDNTVSLTDGNLYLGNEIPDNKHRARYYYISDGTYKGGGEDASDSKSYTNGTYVIWIKMGVPVANAFAVGTFPSYALIEYAPGNSNYAYVSFDSDDVKLITSNSMSDPVIISGGIDEGETMTLTFNGELKRVEPDDENVIVSGKFSFKGKVKPLLPD